MVLGQWINFVAAGLFAIGIVYCFFSPRLRDWTIIVPFVIAGLMLLRRAMGIRQLAQGLEREIMQLTRDLPMQPGTWPPPPRNPGA